MHALVVSIKLAFKNLKSNVSRTLLSLLGIVIGVASVILVLSFGSGIKNYVVGEITTFGTDIISVEVKVPKVSKTSSANTSGQVGGTVITTYKLDDAKKIGQLSNVSAWYAMVISQQITTFEDKKKQVMILGATSGITEADKQVRLESGLMFSDEDDRSLRQVVVLGSAIKDYYFGSSEAVGKSIKIKGQNYKVIGVLKSRGTAGFFNFDEIIYLPLQTVQKKLSGTDYIQSSVFKLKDMNKLDLTVAQVTDVMRNRHNIKNPDDDDFAVNSVVEILEILSTVFFAINALLLALVSISLVVGGVGIMNVMYVAVTERTFEIGLKKAIGAKSFHILAQFLFEAVFLTFLGGVIGIAMGALITQGGEIVASGFGYDLKFTIYWWSIAIGFGFSSFVGIVFGYFPARSASRLTPMEALRKE